MSALQRFVTVSGAAFAALAMTGLATATAAAPVVLSSGHVDVLDAEFDGAAFDLHVHDESVTPDVEYAPADVRLDVPAAAKTVRPAGAAYNFLGAAGSTVWILPQDQAAAAAKGLLWPGISTEHLNSGVFTNDRVTFTLTGAEYDAAGDGVFEDTTAEVSVYGVSGSAVTKFYDGGDGLGASDSRSFLTGSHNHYNWAFEAAGTYRLTFRVSGTTVGGATPSATASYVFSVKP
ncbi:MULTISPECIES: choice-of-anchor M domain-containing protein [unclassified Streptomyces]|uniref:choice-of-anchor M domain-containing protein n=1 Tax=unclassified Streptomyces TaxID=2593676 RepID=UPI00081D68A6|nr:MULTISPECIES: choice-of-anchor M domain-containing protein [unclassified Streptomyces]MYZ36580.1 hypothetical protein [Streptomyces sp. SID4917]SCF84623.1 surface-anchored protein [Streptomyces sp. MnatMP-M17]